MLAAIPSCALFGVDAFHVAVEVEVASGLPRYHVVGLPATSVREGAVRVESALNQVGHEIPNLRVTVNLAPADRRKRGAAFDLPIALGVLVAGGTLPPEPIEGLMILGELGLDGALRPVPGVLSATLLARERGLRGVVVPRACAGEAALVDEVEVYAPEHLSDMIAAMQGDAPLPRYRPGLRSVPAPSATAPDLAEVRGQELARLALEIAVAGGHNVLFVGPPGIGKTMLARRVPTILPPMTRDEALETTKIYSAVGQAKNGLIAQRPFRAPHASVSPAALIGGGSPPGPGEISLAHNGVLFLDELPEFARAAIESLRQPLEDRRIVIGRVQGTVELPASFLLVASANPCPCGWLGSQQRACTCSLGAIERYRARLSGPLLDRIDLQVQVPAVALEDMRRGEPGESSADVRRRVVRARELQVRRLARHGMRCNAEMTPRALRASCELTADAERALARLHEVRGGMTGRAIDRMIKVAQTIADLNGQVQIDAGCIHEAAAFRALDCDPVRDVRQCGLAPGSP